MARRRKNNFSESAEKNAESYRLYLNRLTELSVSMFDWTGLPDSVDPRFLEMTLFINGSAVFFKDEVMGELALPVMMNGYWDVYNVPTKRRAYATNSYQKELDENDSVIIWNNYIRTNSVGMCTWYAKRLWDLDCSIDVNAKAQKTPILIACDESQKLTMLNAYKEFDGNAPVIFGTKNFDLAALKVLTTGAPYVADSLYELKNKIWNEALTYLGISNVSYQKKERLISDEVTRNMGGTIASRYSRLEARREACEKINAMFGLNIECNYREDYRQTDDENMIEGDTGEQGLKGVDPMVVDLRTR